MSALFPIDTTLENPSPRCAAKSIAASEIAPLWVASPSPPGCGINGPKDALSGAAISVLMTPMQFGPINRMPNAACRRPDQEGGRNRGAERSGRPRTGLGLGASVGLAAADAAVIGQDVFLGLVAFTSVSGAFMGWLGDRLRGRDVAIGGTLAFSLALGLLFLVLSTRFGGLAVNILFGSILSIAANDVRFIALFAVIALVLVGVMYRPLLFASVDAEIADARGVPVRALSIAFMVLLAITVSASVQVVGVLLIFARSFCRPWRLNN
jgi:ABC 3 transport family